MGKQIKDRNGCIISKGRKAMWWDYDAEILRGPYKVYEIQNEEMVYMGNKFSEVECPPSEVLMITKKFWAKKMVCPYCGSRHYELEVGSDFYQENVESYTCHTCDRRFGIEK